MTSQNDKNSPLDRLEDYSDLLREPSRLAYDAADHPLAVGVRSRDVTLGEFHLEYEPQRLMNLYLPLPDHKMIEIPIDRRTREKGPCPEETTQRSPRKDPVAEC